MMKEVHAASDVKGQLLHHKTNAPATPRLDLLPWALEESRITQQRVSSVSQLLQKLTGLQQKLVCSAHPWMRAK